MVMAVPVLAHRTGGGSIPCHLWSLDGSSGLCSPHSSQAVPATKETPYDGPAHLLMCPSTTVIILASLWAQDSSQTSCCDAVPPVSPGYLWTASPHLPSPTFWSPQSHYPVCPGLSGSASRLGVPVSTKSSASLSYLLSINLLLCFLLRLQNICAPILDWPPHQWGDFPVCRNLFLFHCYLSQGYRHCKFSVLFGPTITWRFSCPSVGLRSSASIH